MTTGEIIQKCLKRDPAAEKLLYFTYAPFIYSICKRYSRDDHQAKDYMQDGFQRIFEKLNLYDPKKGNFENWIRRLVTNMIFSDKRKKKKDVLSFEDDLGSLPFDLGEESEITGYLDILSGQDILDALRLIPDKYSDVFNLYMIEGRRHKEISEMLHTSETNSRSRLMRAKKLIKEILAKKLTNHQKINKSEEFRA